MTMKRKDNKEKGQYKERNEEKGNMKGMVYRGELSGNQWRIIGE